MKNRWELLPCQCFRWDHKTVENRRIHAHQTDVQIYNKKREIRTTLGILKYDERVT